MFELSRFYCPNETEAACLPPREIISGFRFEPVHEISNNVVCATSKASDQPTRMRSLIRAFASRLNIL